MLTALGIVAVGTMLGSGEDDADVVGTRAPHHDVHHGLVVQFVALAFGLYHVALHHLIESVEEFLVVVAIARDDDEGMAGIVGQHTQIIVVVEDDEFLHILLQPVPLVAKGNLSSPACLKMKMVGSRGTALRSVVEHEQPAVALQKFSHYVIVAGNALRLMLTCGDGEVFGQDRERIYEYMEFRVLPHAHLLLRTILIAEEATALGHGLLADFGSGGDDAGRVELQLQRNSLYGLTLRHNAAHLHREQVAIALAGVGPHLQLARALIAGGRCSFGIQSFAGLQLQRAQTVFIEVVGIDLLYVQLVVTVAAPAPTEIEFVENAADAIATAEGQSHGIVLTITGVGEMNLAHERREEGARCSESVDAQGIVAAILGGPLPVVDDAGR